MNLQGRNLKPNLRGSDVALLQEELRRLGFEIMDLEGFYGSMTFLAVQEFQRQHDLPATGIVDAVTARVINAALDGQPQERYLVRGRLVRPDGTPLPQASIELFEKRLRSDRPIGDTSSDRRGAFEIAYPQPQVTPFSVVVRASGPNGEEIAASDPICDVKPVETVTLVTGGEPLRGPSEFSRLDEVLRPALASEQVDAADVDDEDVEFLACKFDLDAEHVSFYILSSRLRRETGIVAQAYYGWFRQGLPTALEALTAQPEETLEDALLTSIEDNLVDAQLEIAVSRLLRMLKEQIVRLALRDPEPDRPTFSSVFEIVGVESEHRQRILQDYIDREGTVEEYWQGLRDDPEIPDTQLNELQDALKLSAIALNHVDLVRHVVDLRRIGAIGHELRNLSRLGKDDWSQLLNTVVDGRRIGAPEFLGEEEDERVERFAEFLPRMVESVFPTPALTHRLSEMDDPGFDFGPTLTFLRRNPEFEFRTTPIQVYLDENPDALAGVPDTERTVGTLKGVQRLFEIAPAFGKARAVSRLMARRVTSATAIRRMGPTQFIRQNEDALGFEAAQEMYTRAARKADTTLFLLSQSLAFNPTNPAIIAPHLVGQGVPGLEDLFGSLDLCKCRHCRSVYSPAAYLVDILHYLMNRPAEVAGRNALDVLFDRRPDLGEIELSCHNTNTVLPYVDLVLEILETAVIGGGTLSIIEEEDEDRFFPFQTTAEADVLGANPEHLNEQAYDVVRAAIYPWLLPFDLWHEEVRIYLEHLGVPLPELMREFDFDGTPDAAAAVAAEILGLTAQERAILTANSGDPLHTLWGFDDLAGLNQFVAHRNAAGILERSGLTFEELTGVLAVDYVDPGGNLRVQFEGADCRLDTAIVTNLDNGALDRVQRFVRLWRKAPWPIVELGTILATLGIDSLDDAALVALATIAELQRDLKTPLPVLLSWISDRLPTVGSEDQPSLYEQVFLDPTVHKPELEIFTLNAAGTELADPTASLNDHVPLTYSALGISAADLLLLLEAELPDASLNLANLSRLYQASSLAKSLQLSMPEYVSLRALTGIDPFGAGAVDEVRRFAEAAERVRETSFTIAQIDYLLRHRETSAAPAGTSEDEITAALVALRQSLHEIALAHASPESGDAVLQMTESKLALVLPADVANGVVAIANRTSDLAQEDQVTLIQDHLAFFVDPSLVTAAWFDGEEAQTADPAVRALVVLEPLLGHLRRIAGESLVIQTMAAAFGLELAAADQLLRTFVPVPDTDDPTLDVFLEEGFVPSISETEPDFEGTTTAESFGAQYASYRLLAKVALVLETLGVPADGIEHYFTRGLEAGWLDPVALHLEPVDEPAVELDTLLQTAAVFLASESVFGDTAALFEVLRSLDDGEIDRQGFLAAVASRAGWDASDLTFLTGSSALNVAFADGFRDGRFLVRLRPLFDCLRSIPVAAEIVHRWANQEIDAGTARGVKQAARARYEDKDQWLRVAKPLRDELRERQRAALVAHLVHTIRIQVPHFETPQPGLHQGSRRPAVRELQLRLNMAGAVPPLKVDGIFGPKTRQAVEDFQQANGLADDGIVGPATWAALNQIDRRLRGPNELYAHFLIDVEMTPCMLTSRVVLAHSSIQLFVQRCFLNLEPEVELSPEDAKEWAWMKRYRVWEANRKVFLYPENWIYPELRDDKTPLFKELESGLLQDEIKDRTIEREYLKYLKGLGQIAHLEIVCVHRQWEATRDVLHVFGRTHNTPHLYFYRQWVDQRYWTPWERVNLDIEGDHLTAIEWNRRLYVFWPMFMEKSKEVQVGAGEDPPPPLRRYEVRMAWSEYRDGSWGPQQISDAVVVSPSFFNLVEKGIYSFWPQIDGADRLHIVHNLDTTRPFRLEAGSGRMRVVKNGVRPKMGAAFPGTDIRFDRLREKTGRRRLKVRTSGDIVEFGIADVLSDVKYSGVLRRTPGKFEVVLPCADRLFVSRSPFAYSDQRRSFFVIPRGRYSGGFSDPEIGITFRSAQAPIPMELPDTVAQSVANFVIADAAASQAVEPDDEVAARSRTGGLLARTRTRASVALGPLQWEARNFRFENHYHPYAGMLVEELNRYGIDGILKPDPAKEKHPSRRQRVRSLRRQRRKRSFFRSSYRPKQIVDQPRPVEEFDFDYGGAYSVYNWELFFHAPLMLAKRLSDHQRFAEAHRWFHYLFDPTYRPAQQASEPWPERVWQVKPFFEHGVGESIQRTMLLLKSSGLTAAERKQRKSLQDQIEAWRQDPFNPHLIARMRPEAYMKATVMAYLDNLIAWGDSLFRQDTIESINEATQLYILAAEILGERPREIAAHEDAVPTINGEEVKTFNDLRGRLDAFSNVLIELETLVEPDDAPGDGGGIGGLVAVTDELAAPEDDDGGGIVVPDLPLAAKTVEPPDDTPPIVAVPLAEPVPAVLGPALFFCIPKNDKLLGYWDTVEDRLFKIRHCMNIEGVVRQLPLFQPPIDPGALVKAAAAGVDIGSALNELNAPLPAYRFQTMRQMANEILNDLKSLGGAVLSALEKRDAEELALLRSTQETGLLKSVLQIKKQSIEEARLAVEAVKETRKVTEFRREYYRSLPRTNAKEEEHLQKLEQAHQAQLAGQIIEVIRGVLAALPNFDIGVAGISSPVVKASWGGSQLASILDAASRGASIGATVFNYQANRASIEGGFDRREDDWSFQAEAAEKELRQIDRQIAATEIRIAVAEADLQSHEVQIENAEQTEEYLTGKYTSPELYSWMLSQIAGVYFQSYQLAYDLANQAERAYRYELGLEASEGPKFIQFGYWDNLKKGLLAGERLQADLRRLEVAYLEKHQREYELTKHVSLATLNPLALLRLKEQGRCEIEVPEALFDLDYAGHYFRRIKSVSLTIPAVTGPYATLSCTLRLLSSSTRRQSTLLDGEYARDTENDDPRFSDSFGAIQSIATSGGQNDSGLFELSFRDERFLPFEGAGTISRWQLEMPVEFRQFDYDSISDVILHINYTAREGGAALRDAANQHLRDAMHAMVIGDDAIGLHQAFSARHEFSTALHRFLHPPAEAEQVQLTLDLARDRFPHMFKGRDLQVDQVHLFVRLDEEFSGADATGTVFTLTHPGGEEILDLGAASALGNLRQISVGGLASSAGEWVLDLTSVGSDLEGEAGRLDPQAVEDVLLILHYTVAGSP